MNIESIGNNQYALEGMTENELRPGTWRNLAGSLGNIDTFTRLTLKQ